MGRIFALLITAVLFFIPQADPPDHDPTGEAPLADHYIEIVGASDLISSPYLKGGDGSEGDPYVISGIPADSTGIRIHNLSYNVVLKNITIDSESEKLALDLKNITSCHLENVTVSNHDHAMMARWRREGKMDLSINNSVFRDLPRGYEPVSGSNTYPFRININGSLDISNSAISTYRNSSKTWLYTTDSRWTNITDSTLDGVNIQISSTISDVGFITGQNRVVLTNCNVINRSRLKSKSHLFLVKGCLFNDSNLDENYFMDTNTHIINNTFMEENSYIRFYKGLTYNPWWDYGSNIIEGNIFENSSGLWTKGENNNFIHITNWSITENYFGNCSDGAIRWDHPKCNNVKIWRNTFYHNRKTDDNFTGVPQIDISCSAYLIDTFNLSRKGIGNYWSDRTSPDKDNDAIVDDEYVISYGWGYNDNENLSDPCPVTNPWFDLERPFIRILEPSENEIDGDYVKVIWEAYDADSGLDRVLLSTDNENWTDVTGSDYWPLELKDENNTIYLKAYDRAGLYNMTSVNLSVIDPDGPVELLSPEAGEILMSGEVDINWSVDDYFLLADQSLLLDSEDLGVDLDDRSQRVEIEDGLHNVKLRCRDLKGFEISREASFIVDTGPPVIDIASPGEDLIYSNILMNFIWSVRDINGVVSVRYRVDDGDWNAIDIQTSKDLDLERGEFLSEGLHRIEIEAVDIAGRKTVNMVNFSIGKGSLVITEPEDGSVTNEVEVMVHWWIEDDFHPVRLEAVNIELGEIINATSSTSCTVELKDNVRNRIEVTAYDVFGNSVSDTVTVSRDITPPSVWIINDEAAVNDRPLLISWEGADELGIAGFRYRFDDGEWTDVARSGSLDLGEPEEGAHKFEVECRDRANNSAVDVYEFVYDITPPEVEFENMENPLILHESRCDLEWSCDDERGVESIHLLIDQTEHELASTDSNWQGRLESGMHRVKIIVKDEAGNRAFDNLTVLVDTMDPILDWKGEIDSPTNLKKLPLRWNASDRVGIRRVVLREDEKVIWSDTNGGEVYFSHGADEGMHIYILEALDLSGRSSRIEREITVDRTPPVLSSLDTEYNGGVLKMSWTSVDNLTAVVGVVIRFDGNIYEFDDPNGTREVKGVDPGAYQLKVDLTDQAGNTIQHIKEIDAVKEDEGGKEDNNLTLWVFIILGITLVVLVSIGISIYIGSRRAGDKDRIGGNGDERMNLPKGSVDKESLGPGSKPPPMLDPARSYDGSKDD